MSVFKAVVTVEDRRRVAKCYFEPLINHDIRNRIATGQRYDVQQLLSNFFACNLVGQIFFDRRPQVE